ncbi:MAG: diacylglycerol/lipid kinase family protein, partial [Vicinamibacteria bacterium]
DLRVVLVFNPRSGRGRAKETILDRVLDVLRRAGMEVEVHPTERPGHATEIASRASREGIDRVLAWGGDGTLNEVMRGLVGTDTAMGVLPGGTVNVFAREVGIPLEIEAATEAFVRGEVARIPVGVASGRPFLLMAGVGLDAEVVYRLKAGFKHTLGAVAFWLDGFRLLASYPMPSIRVVSGGREVVGSGIIAGKMRRYGPRYFITPGARLEEPKLEVVVFKGKNRRDYLRYLAGVIGGFHTKLGDVECFKTDALTVEADRPVRYQLDGEFAGNSPLRLEVRDRALAVVLPEVRKRNS